MQGALGEALLGQVCGLCAEERAEFACKECWALVCPDCVCLHNQGAHRCLRLARLLPLFKDAAQGYFQGLTQRLAEEAAPAPPKDISELPDYELLVESPPPARAGPSAELERERHKNRQLKTAIRALQAEKLMTVESCRRETARLTRLVQNLRSERREGSHRTERLFSAEDE